MTTKSTKIVRSSGNVFADLGLPNAQELSTKVELAFLINESLAGVTQQKAASRLGLPQPKISKLRNYRLDNFSVEKLMHLLTKLDRDIEIVVRRRPATQKRGAHIVVVPAQ
jgi:predicted XRE-type DNA-binding protein